MVKATGHKSAPVLIIVPLTPEKEALVLYTSSSDTYPRDVVHTFGSIEAQIKTLCTAWRWQFDDRLLHVLPIAHIHGLVCGLLCTLAAGASCVLLPSFKTVNVWEQLALRSCSLLTAVPTIYQYLLDKWERKDDQTKRRWQEGAKELRLAIVGGAPLPTLTHSQWLALTDKPLVTRYGLTEVGMVLSQHDEALLRPECLGRPLPRVMVRLVDESGALVEGVGGVRSTQTADVQRIFW